MIRQRDEDGDIYGHVDKPIRTSAMNTQVPVPCELDQCGVARHDIFRAEVRNLMQTYMQRFCALHINGKVKERGFHLS